MTREDAIYWIKNLAVLATEKDMLQIEEALNMAIESLADRKTEPTSSKMEQVDKDINVRSKTEPQRGCDADCNEDCIECAKETELWKAEQTEREGE